ncbi:hypothetical protein ACGFW5_24435 [Streptomyces sp. NPDC048416]|uniref:hypothetical protein n=1 Tax=Streptomyces sp. NPDC048416 TaxID=3365546 RepID=UPI0037154684
MTTQPSPYGYQRYATVRRVPFDGADEQWWVAPSACTVTLMLSAWFDLTVLSWVGYSTGMMALFYGAPAVLVAVCWGLPHRRSLRAARIALGATGAGVALLVPKVLALGYLVLVGCVCLLFGVAWGR